MQTKDQVFQIIETAYTREFADKIISSYTEIENNFLLEKWKASELDAGHFVEAIRRVIEQELLGSYTPFNQQLSSFSDAVLKQYENQQGDEAFRMLIPRVLKSIYNIRNKRGVGHLTGISPNEMDSTLILYSVKWVLSELIRLKTNLPIARTQSLIDNIVERKIDLIWKQSDVRRILQSGISAKNQILILLYDKSPQTADELVDIIEYKNKSNFKILLKKMHSERLLEYESTGKSTISPKGLLEAEEIIKKIKVSK